MFGVAALIVGAIPHAASALSAEPPLSAAGYEWVYLDVWEGRHVIWVTPKDKGLPHAPDTSAATAAAEVLRKRYYPDCRLDDGQQSPDGWDFMVICPRGTHLSN